MIVKNIWVNTRKTKRKAYMPMAMRGWFLFGFIPLYIVEVKAL